MSLAEDQLEAVYAEERFWRYANNFPIQARQRIVLNRLLDNFEGQLTNAKCTKLAKRSPDTTLRNIRQLLGWGLLIANAGGGRSPSYRLAHP